MEFQISPTESYMQEKGRNLQLMQLPYYTQRT